MIDATIDYVVSLKNIPRGTYDDTISPTENEGPFYTGKGLYTSSYDKGMVCVGLANLARRFNHLDVPGMDSTFPGGTEAWFDHLYDRLEKIDFKKIVPRGTLLVQDYNETDHGHVSIVIKSSELGLYDSTIIHSISDNTLCGTYIHRVSEYSNYKRHTHICLPEYWLLQN